MVKLPERWQRAVEQNGETVVQSRCWEKMKNVPVIATPGKNQRNLSPKIKVPVFQMCISAAFSWPFGGMTP